MWKRHKELLWRTKMESWWNSWELCRRNQVFMFIWRKIKGHLLERIKLSTPPLPVPLSKRGRSLLTQLPSRYGYACYSSCSKGEESYYWCYTSWHIHKVMNRQSTSNRNWPLLLNTVCLKMWEYCAPPNKTIYGARCASECAKRGKDYWWECHC